MRLRHKYIVTMATVCFFPVVAGAQQDGSVSTSVIVQPGKPGEPTRILPTDVRPIVSPISKKDIEFMKGMIMHHEQALVMTSLIESRTTNRDIRLLGARIARSQQDEINFMKLWLEARGLPVEESISDNSHVTTGHSKEKHKFMPGMLTPMQIGALMRAKGEEFDRLFLKGMIQHHRGALVMVKELFDTPGAGQDAELFSFASDVDSSQRAEIKSMETLLNSKP